MSKTRLGVWTPWSEVLCQQCHDEINNPWKRDVKFGRRPDDKQGFCTRCHEPVWVRYDVAVLTRIQREVGGDMQQTGGMCAALVIERSDKGHVVVTCETDVLVGIYKPGAWDEGEQEERLYHVPLKPISAVYKAVRQAVKETL